MGSLAKALYRCRDNAADCHRLTILEQDWRKRFVTRPQLQGTSGPPELLDCEITVHLGDHNVTMVGIEGTIANQNVTIENPKIDHGRAAGPPHKCRMRMGYEEIIQVVAFDCKVCSR